MGIPLVLLLKTLCFFVTSLSVHGSLGPSFSPHHTIKQRHGGLDVLLEANSPTRALARHKYRKASTIAIPPSSSFASSPSISHHKHHHHHHHYEKNKFIGSASGPTPAPSPTQSSQYEMPIISPTISPSDSSMKRSNTAPPLAIMALPPPPPNKDCTLVTCKDPLTYTVPGSSCGCVQPIQVRLRLSVALYTFFPLVSELAREIATSVLFNQSQVRIMGADSANQQLDKTIVVVNLIPIGSEFNSNTAYLIYKKFWNKQVFIKRSLFGAYEVLYVHYPGLPPSPPSASSAIASIDDGSFPGHDHDGRKEKPIGVDIPKRRKDSHSRSMIAVIALSTFTAFIICVGVAWILIVKYGLCAHRTRHASIAKLSGAPATITLSSRTNSSVMSINSSMLTYTGSAKTFTLNEIEKATNNFDNSKILGEGGFGLVYSGLLEDGTEGAVKVLKRNDQQGGREFLAEVEMLSRLHHRNLVKLIGICTDNNTRCLVYELISNGSVESHLHGIDKERGPLDWISRMKIALGAARGLAYLHEDSSPRVIHRDFKSSNILLEDDFTPKVSDFGLARSALEEGNKQTATRVMGTFGYLAPEYAMTGHLLVKSDVYSYGVVLLELLTGRKPVDMSQPSGQENLVLWARPLLTKKENIEKIIDPFFEYSNNIPFDTVAKVAAIASMCVQPEVNHRPFMGEVVQALKLVCNEFEDTKDVRDDFSIEMDNKIERFSGDMINESYHISGYDSNVDGKITLSTSDLVSVAAEVEGKDMGAFRRYANSGPLMMGKKRLFWQRLRRFSKGSTSEEHDFGFMIDKKFPHS